MNKNTTEEKVVTESTAQNIGFKNTKTNKNVKWIIFCAMILVYTLIIAGVTITVDRVMLKKQFEDSWKEAFDIVEEFEDDKNSSNNISNNTTLGTTEQTIEEKKINLNQTVTIGDVMELTLESSAWVDEIKPSNTSGSTSGYPYCYEDKDGEKYFVVKGKIKNIASEDLTIQYANESQIIVNDTYKAFVIIDSEETDGSSFFSLIKPLQTRNVVILASVSDEVYNLCKNVKLTLNLLSDSSKIGYVYVNSYPHETYAIDFNNTNS